MAIISKYYSSPETERGEFLRKNGLYLATIKSWIENPFNLFNGKMIDPDVHEALKKELTETQKDLREREKALAETAILLFLKKKPANWI